MAGFGAAEQELRWERRGKEKKHQTAKRLDQIESKGKAEEHRAENTPARPSHAIILLIHWD